MKVSHVEHQCVSYLILVKYPHPFTSSHICGLFSQEIFPSKKYENIFMENFCNLYPDLKIKYAELYRKQILLYFATLVSSVIKSDLI